MSIDKDLFMKVMLAKDDKPGGGITVKIAAVTSLSSGKAMIQFDEDSQPSLKPYKALKSYTPVVGDRVMLINNVIIGGWTP